MLGQGLAGRELEAELEPVMLPGQQATAVALVFCELFGNALEHGRGRVSVDLRRDGGSILLAVADEGDGPQPGRRQGLGLTIATALVREELRGRIELRGRAVVRFPAVS
jgi:two-component sensor histidine kinase